MKTYVLPSRRAKPSPLGQAIRANKPLDKPLTRTEKQVLYVLMKSYLGEIPDEETRSLILRISRQGPTQWTRTVTRYPELVEAINSFLFGNLIERCIAARGCKGDLA